MDPWLLLEHELAQWSEPPALWWRDDDAVASSAALDRLLALRAAADVPVSLSVVPGPAQPALADVLRGEPGITVLQHGWMHRNRAPTRVKKTELGYRPVDLALRELREGWRRLSRLFGAQARPVLVPPWNRFPPTLAGRLDDAGLKALSAYRGDRGPGPVRRVDCHLDPVDWRGTRGFAGAERVLPVLVAELARRRSGAGIGPVGVLTHHFAMDEAGWRFQEMLLARTSGRARWVDPFRGIA